ncbi:hypothetical protein IAU59_003893 [Kwoniella sp. CBS 9459]
MSLIGRFEHLPNRPRSDEARPLLEKIASQVKPIMSKRGWKVGTLAEFVPSDPSLLGLNQNRGQRIQLRLRPPGAEHTFYEYDQLVLVMLHELTHNEHGPHDAKFYKLLAELEEEYYDLKRKGYSGEGFHSSGSKLNGIRVNEYEGRARGLAAAERRLATQRKIGRGGVLGGTGTGGKSMKELIAEAAERRLKDDKSCQAGSSSAVEAEVKRAQEESIGINASDLGSNAIDSDKGVEVGFAGDSGGTTLADVGKLGNDKPEADVIDLTTSSDDEGGIGNSGRAGSSRSNGAAPSGSSLTPTTAASAPSVSRATEGNQPKRKLPPANNVVARQPAIASSSKAATPSTPSSPRTIPKIPAPSRGDRQPVPQVTSTTWTCATCTLINPPSAKSCEACTTSRPGISIADAAQPEPGPVADTGGAGTGIWTEEGWFCEFCGDGPREKAYWSCAECGWVRKWG